MDTAPVLVPVQRVGEFAAGEITVCESREDGGLYTVLCVRDRQLKLMLVEADAKMSESGGEYRFSLLQSGGDALTVAAPHIFQRGFADFAASDCQSVHEKVALCLRLVRECMASGMPWWLLYLCLSRDNVQLYKSGAVQFDLLIDLDGANPEKNERDCARRCGGLIWGVLDSLTEQEKRRSNAYIMMRMVERNDSYATLMQLHRDLETVLHNPARAQSLGRVWDFCKKHIPAAVNTLRITAAVAALAVAIALLKGLFFSDISLLPLRYGGLDKIGEVSLMRIPH